MAGQVAFWILAAMAVGSALGVVLRRNPIHSALFLVAHLATLGLLTTRTAIVHGVWVSDADIELLAGHGTSVVHNPVSNLKLGAGIAPS